MPFIRIETNQSVTDEAAKPLLADLSRLAARLLGKPEDYVMVALRPGQAMSFAGSGAPLAYVEAKSIGLEAGQAPGLSRAICDFLAKRLGIPPDRIYIEFASAPGELWGWNGETF